MSSISSLSSQAQSLFVAPTSRSQKLQVFGSQQAPAGQTSTLTDAPTIPDPVQPINGGTPVSNVQSVIQDVLDAVKNLSNGTGTFADLMAAITHATQVAQKPAGNDPLTTPAAPSTPTTPTTPATPTSPSPSGAASSTAAAAINSTALTATASITTSVAAISAPTAQPEIPPPEATTSTAALATTASATPVSPIITAVAAAIAKPSSTAYRPIVQQPADATATSGSSSSSSLPVLRVATIDPRLLTGSLFDLAG